jgi:hypothetical protein
MVIFNCFWPFLAISPYVIFGYSKLLLAILAYFTLSYFLFFVFAIVNYFTLSYLQLL